MEYYLAKNTINDDFPCIGCPIFTFCKDALDKDGNITQKIRVQLKWMPDRYKDILSLCIQCKKSYPLYTIKIRQKYSLVHFGNEILTADSEDELLRKQSVNIILTVIFFTIIGSIICGIAELFK